MVRVRVSYRVGGGGGERVLSSGAIVLESSESIFKIYVFFTTTAMLIE